jgi:type VI secretion system protein ImpH
MAGADGKTAYLLELTQSLQERPYAFDFLYAVRRLECAHPDQPRLGESGLPREDSVRLAQEASLRFAPASIVGFHPAKGPRPAQLVVTFFGLFGPNGPLPLHLTDYARERLRIAKDPTFSAFADVFHHRMLSLLFRSWANAQPTVSFDRPAQDRYGEYVASLFGVGAPAFRNRDDMPDLAKLHFAGRLSLQTQNREGLQAMLSDFFRIRVVIEQFVGHWMQLPDVCRWRLGQDPSTGLLGQSTVAGASVWDRQSKFRIMLGPLKYSDFVRFLPTGSSLRRFVAFVRNYAGDELQWDLNLRLTKKEVPRFQLGTIGQLGWNTWCASQPMNRDVDDVCLEPERHGEFQR